MPYLIRKVNNKSCYRVSKKSKTSKKKRVFSKCTSMENAKKQIRLLSAIENNRNFVPRGRTIKKSPTL